MSQNNKKKPYPLGDPLIESEKQDCRPSVPMPRDLAKIEVLGEYRLRERKLFTLLVHSVWFKIGVDRIHFVNYSEVARAFRLFSGGGDIKEWLENYTPNLMTVNFRHRDDEGLEMVRLFSYLKLNHKENKIIFEFPLFIEQMIRGDLIFSRLDTHFFLSIRSKYTAQLYHFLQSFVDLNKVEGLSIEIADIRKKIFGIEDKRYQKFKAFNQKVIKPAVEEINNFADSLGFYVEYETVRTGRSVKSLNFKVKKVQKPYAKRTIERSSKLYDYQRIQ